MEKKYLLANVRTCESVSTSVTLQKAFVTIKSASELKGKIFCHKYFQGLENTYLCFFLKLICYEITSV